MHVVRLLSPKLDNETHAKDIDFSPAGIRQRWEAGYADTMRALWRQPWIGEFGLLDGVILHEPEPGAEPAAEVEPASRPEAGCPTAARTSSPRSEGASDGRLYRHLGHPA